MDVTQIKIGTDNTAVGSAAQKRKRIPRPTALGTLAAIGVIAIVTGIFAAPLYGWRYYRNTQQVELSKEVTAAWAAHWAEAKDAEGKALTAPLVNGIVHYPERSFLFLYTDPATGKQAAMTWMNNSKLEAEALQNIWVPLAVQEQAAPSGELGK